MVLTAVFERALDFLTDSISLLSFILGGLVVLLADMGLNWNKRRMRRQRIRREFILELECMKHPLQELRAAVARGESFDAKFYMNQLSPDIYRANLDDLKYLRPKELGALYVFYQGLNGLLDTIDEENGQLTDFQTAQRRAAVKIENTSFADTHVTVTDMDDLLAAHSEVLDRLSQHPDTLYGQIPEERPFLLRE